MLVIYNVILKNLFMREKTKQKLKSYTFENSSLSEYN